MTTTQKLIAELEGEIVWDVNRTHVWTAAQLAVNENLKASLRRARVRANAEVRHEWGSVPTRSSRERQV